jgi:hypothetical protein
MISPFAQPVYAFKEQAVHVSSDTATPDQSTAFKQRDASFKQRDASATQPATIAHAMLSIAAKHGDMLAVVVAGKSSAVTKR